MVGEILIFSNSSMYGTHVTLLSVRMCTHRTILLCFRCLIEYEKNREIITKVADYFFKIITFYTVFVIFVLIFIICLLIENKKTNDKKVFYYKSRRMRNIVYFFLNDDVRTFHISRNYYEYERDFGNEKK